MTVTDQSSGKQFYEIYLRRERTVTLEGVDEEGESTFSSQSVPSKGLNSFCLVQRDEIPSSSTNLFHFADADRDSMIDLIFVTRNDLSLHVFYNKLNNQQRTHEAQGESQLEQKAISQFSGIPKICADTNRPVNKIKDIYSSFSQPEEKYVIKQAVSSDSSAIDLQDENNEMPARLYIGDITSDGYPDILLTVKYLNGSTRPSILVN
mmetsp:Transcript_15396/g.14988  ORF Transcript_15396/g.14988 Transcript_15396/m.14988 type:complete len:207 (+) Transcript_15396:435-1055(+)